MTHSNAGWPPLRPHSPPLDIAKVREAEAIIDGAPPVRGVDFPPYLAAFRRTPPLQPETWLRRLGAWLTGKTAA